MNTAAPNKATVEFSIVTVAFNCEDTIEATMQSVFSQTYTNYEYLVIDGRSTDRTTDIVSRYASSLAAFVSEKDGGIYDAMNKGIGLAKGRWILFLNSGDVLADASVLEKVAAVAASTSADILYGDILIRKRGQLVVKPADEPCHKHRMYFCHQSAFTRLHVMKATPFDLRFRLSADFYFFKQCYYAGLRFVHIPLPLVIYDRNGISNTHRLAGLAENVKVVKLLDKGWTRFVFLLRLYFVMARLKLRGQRR